MTVCGRGFSTCWVGSWASTVGGCGGHRDHRQALAMCLELGDAEAGCAARASLAAQLTLTGQPSPELFAEAIESAGARRPFALGRWPQVFHSRAMLWSGDLEAARRGLLRAEKDAVALGSEFQRPYRLCDLAILDVAAGDLDSAIARADEGTIAARDAGNEQAIAWLAYPLGLAAALQGRRDRAESAADLLKRWGETNEELPRLATAEEVLGSMAATAGTRRGHFITSPRWCIDWTRWAAPTPGPVLGCRGPSRQRRWPGTAGVRPADRAVDPSVRSAPGTAHRCLFVGRTGPARAARWGLRTGGDSADRRGDRLRSARVPIRRWAGRSGPRASLASGGPTIQRPGRRGGRPSRLHAADAPAWVAVADECWVGRGRAARAGP